MMRPTISVIMSVFNGARYLRESVESILDQTYTDYEFLITDDGSTDESPSILARYVRQDSRIRLVRQENRGLTESLNRMIAESGSTYVARMDADDISLPERLKKQVEKLVAHPAYPVVGCWYQLIDEQGMARQEVNYPEKPDLLRERLYKGINCYAHGSVMLRREALAPLQPPYRFRYGQDLDLWLRLSEQGPLGMVEDALYQHRRHYAALSRALVAQRAPLCQLMLTLAQERRTHGRETTDWRKEEARIISEVPVWTESEQQTYGEFLKASALLHAGENRKARVLLSSIKPQAGKIAHFGTAYFLSFLPSFASLPFLMIRRKLIEMRSFVRSYKL